MLAAQVTPLSVSARVVGALLGLGLFAAGAYLLRRCRREQDALPTTGGGPQGASARLRAGLRWRVRTARLMIACSLLIVAGVFVDPRIFPRGFIVLWTTILALVQILMGLALHDLLVVRRRAFEEKSRLLRENRKEMERELRDY